MMTAVADRTDYTEGMGNTDRVTPATAADLWRDMVCQAVSGINALRAPAEDQSERDQESADNLRLIDFIADKIGLLNNQELSQENFSAWFAASRPADAGQSRNVEYAATERAAKIAEAFFQTIDAKHELLRANTKVVGDNIAAAIRAALANEGGAK